MSTLLYFGAIVIILILLLNGPSENLTNVTQNACCTDKCIIWNHVDAASQCNKACKLSFPDKNPSFTGTYSKNGCECTWLGKETTSFVSYPPSESNKGDCFFWNNGDATTHCQTFCDKYLPNRNATWTNTWKNTSSQTSACECKYAD